MLQSLELHALCNKSREKCRRYHRNDARSGRLWLSAISFPFFSRFQYKQVEQISSILRLCVVKLSFWHNFKQRLNGTETKDQNVQKDPFPVMVLKLAWKWESSTCIGTNRTLTTTRCSAESREVQYHHPDEIEINDRFVRFVADGLSSCWCRWVASTCSSLMS